MFEKKNYIVNCDVCDTRKITQESLSGYEQIVINADLLLVDENSRAILNRLPLICNADETLDVEGELSVICANGSYEISGDTRIEDQTVICVNGDLSVRSGTQKVLEKILKICVNGSAKYPESMAPFLNRLAVNGSVQCIPDGCIELKPVFTIDRFFPLRARQNGSYYVDEKVVLMDPEADVESLVAKNVRFVTKRFLVRQELISRSIALFEESVEMDVIPTGFAFVDGDTELTDALLQKHGTRLYIDGDLNLKDGSENCLERLDALCVKGNVRLLKRQEEAFSRVDATYEALVFVKGRYIANQPKIVVDQALLEASPDGMEIRNCAVLKVKKDAAAELILERLWVGNCAHVFCSPEQKSSIQLVCGNVAKISEGEQEEEEDEGGMLGKLKKMMGSRVVNADTYIL